MFSFYEDIVDNYKNLSDNLEDLKQTIADIKVSNTEEFQKKEQLLLTISEDISSVKGFIAKRLEKEVS